MRSTSVITFKPRHQRAFSLAELIAVLVIIGILVTVALPDMASSNRTYLLDAAANRILAALRFAQSQAVTTGTDHGCLITPSANTFSVFQAVGAPPYPTATDPVKKTPYTVDFDTEPGFGGITISSTTFPADTITFDSLGSPDNGGTITLSLSGFNKLVAVSAVTGLIEKTDP